jgi:hypothetical protein
MAHSADGRRLCADHFVLTMVIFVFGGIAAAFAWADAQNRGPDK